MKPILELMLKSSLLPTNIQRCRIQFMFEIFTRKQENDLPSFDTYTRKQTSTVPYFAPARMMVLFMNHAWCPFSPVNIKHRRCSTHNIIIGFTLNLTHNIIKEGIL